jgi:hypothetical protein
MRTISYAWLNPSLLDSAGYHETMLISHSHSLPLSLLCSFVSPLPHAHPNRFGRISIVCMHISIPLFPCLSFCSILTNATPLQT